MKEIVLLWDAFCSSELNKYKSLHKYINSIIQTNNIMIKIDILGVSK